MKVFEISMNQIARYTLPLPDVRFKIDELVEIQYRVGDTDEYGWWSARVKGFDEISGNYLIQWYGNPAREWIPKVRVRKAAFVF